MFCTAWLVLALLPAGRQSVTLTVVWRELPVSFRFCTRVGGTNQDPIQLDAGSLMLTIRQLSPSNTEEYCTVMGYLLWCIL